MIIIFGELTIRAESRQYFAIVLSGGGEIATTACFHYICIMAKSDTISQTPDTRNRVCYLNYNPSDEIQGLYVTTAGFQRVDACCDYPIRKHHRNDYYFNPDKGRILNEYQLIYVTGGGGFFESDSCPRRKVRPGTVITLFPNEWHTYSPDRNGWEERWVGIKGDIIDRWVEGGILSKEKPVNEIGIIPDVISLYERLLRIASEEGIGHQQLLAGIALNLIGEVNYRSKNLQFGQTDAMKKIVRARNIMKNSIENPVAPAAIAEKLCVSYSWFRRTFKAYTGLAPALYQQNLRHLRAKELLTTTDMSISEIAYTLNFEGLSQFSIAFAKKEGISPTRFRKHCR